MRAEPNPESPNSDENPSQKQDPLERRRLQNRLSQRNHRKCELGVGKRLFPLDMCSYHQAARSETASPSCKSESSPTSFELQPLSTAGTRHMRPLLSYHLGMDPIKMPISSARAIPPLSALSHPPLSWLHMQSHQLHLGRVTGRCLHIRESCLAILRSLWTVRLWETPCVLHHMSTQWVTHPLLEMASMVKRCTICLGEAVASHQIYL